MADLQDRLVEDGVDFEVEDIPAALEQLGQEELIMYGPRPQQTAFNLYPSGR